MPKAFRAHWEVCRDRRIRGLFCDLTEGRKKETLQEWLYILCNYLSETLTYTNIGNVVMWMGRTKHPIDKKNNK